MKAHDRKIVQRVSEEFEEMPGLRLTVREASRFLAIDEPTCELVLTELAGSGFLARGADDRFHVYAEV